MTRSLAPLATLMALLFTTGSQLAAATPTDDLMRFIPRDAGICLIVQDLRGHFDQVRQSPFASRFRESKFGQAILTAPEIRRLTEFEQQLSTALGLTLAQLRDEILGDAVALAYTPGLPEREGGVLIINARKPERLAAVISRLNELQKQSGELVAVESRQYEGQTIVARRKRNGEEFYCLRGSVLVFSDKERFVRAALHGQRPTNESESSPIVGQLKSLGVDRNGVVLWINPRAFDAQIKEKMRSAQGPDAAVLRTFAACWSALDGAAWTLRLDSDLSLDLVLSARPQELPPGIRRLLSEARKPSNVWSAFPANALFAAAGRFSWDAATEVGREVVPAEGQKAVRDMLDRSVAAVLGRDAIPELLRAIGPDFGLCITPPDAAGKTWLPMLTAVMRLHGAGRDMPVERRVLDGLDFAARLAVLGVNSNHASRWQLRTEKQGDVEVRFVEGDAHLPPGLQPAYAWKSGYLVLGSSPAAIHRFEPPPVTDAVPADKANPLVRLAVTGWSQYLRTYREPLTRFAAQQHHAEPAEVSRSLDRLLDVLDLFDSLELTQRSTADRATLTLRLRTASGLK